MSTVVGNYLASGMMLTSVGSSSSSPAVDSSTGAHTITPAQFASRDYIASGLTADASHTSPSGTDIAASGRSVWTVVNPTASILTLLAGTGVTITGSAVIDPSTSVTFSVTPTSSSAATLTRLYSEGVGA